MRKFIALFVILAFVLAVGCAKQAVQPTAPAAAPPITQVNPGAEPAQPAAPAAETPAGSADVASDYTHTVSGPVPEAAGTGALGNRMEGTEKAGEDQLVSESSEYPQINLTPEKTMSMSEIKIAKGTVLYWKNLDSWPHVLAVDSGSGFDTKRWGKSEQLLEGNVWNFTFSNAGVFVVRDMFSGAMRMTVTVE
jgi:plastocyanin